MGVMRTVLVCLYGVISTKIIEVPGDSKTIKEGGVFFGLK